MALSALTELMVLILTRLSVQCEFVNKLEIKTNEKTKTKTKTKKHQSTAHTILSVMMLATESRKHLPSFFDMGVPQNASLGPVFLVGGD